MHPYHLKWHGLFLEVHRPPEPLSRNRGRRGQPRTAITVTLAEVRDYSHDSLSMEEACWAVAPDSRSIPTC